MQRWLTIGKIALLLRVSKSTIIRRAHREHWAYRSYPVRGGQERRFHIKDLPEDIQIAYAKSLKLDLEALQRELKPPLKVDSKAKLEVKVVVEGYKCRSTTIDKRGLSHRLFQPASVFQGRGVRLFA
jgi:hypothetical protein